MEQRLKTASAQIEVSTAEPLAMEGGLAGADS